MESDGVWFRFKVKRDQGPIVEKEVHEQIVIDYEKPPIFEGKRSERRDGSDFPLLTF